MKTPYNLRFIQTDETKGVLTVSPNLSLLYRIEVADFFGNKKLINVPIQYDLTSTRIAKEEVSGPYRVKAAKDSNFEMENASVFFPAGTFYDDFNLNFKAKNNSITVHDDTVPAHSNFTITIKDSTLTAAQREKMFIGRVDGKKISYNATFRKDDFFQTKVKVLGTYALVSDTVAPRINMVIPIEGKWINQQKSVQFTIADDLSGIKSYNGYLNGKWVLFEYDNKTRKITHFFTEGLVADGANELKVVVVDNMGNSTTFETRFFRNSKP